MKQYEQREEAFWSGGPPAPPPGDYRITFLDNIDIHHNDESGKDSLMIPVTVVDDGKEHDGHQIRIFIPLSSENPDFAEQKMYDILHAAGLAAKFEEKFPGDISILDRQVIDQIKLRLPDKACIATIGSREYNNKTYSDIKGVKPLTNGTGKPARKKSAPQPQTDNTNTGWD